MVECGLVPVTTKAGYHGKHIYEILTDRLQGLERLLVGYGFSDPIPRIQLHLRFLNRLRDGGKIASNELLWSLVEATELGDIYCSFPRMSTQMLRKKFKAILDGPEFPQEETTASNLARNTTFEIRLASLLAYRGVPTRMNHNPDVACTVSDRHAFIQCKRPFSRQKVRDNMNRACKQLSRDLDTAGDSKNRGVVAISLTHAINPHSAYMEVKTEADLVPAMESQIRPVADRNMEALIRGPRIVGAVFHFVTAAHIRDINEYRTGQLLIYYISQYASASDRAMLRRLFRRRG